MSKKTGKLIILHGSSSSGKTEIANELLLILKNYEHEHLHRFVNNISKQYKINTKNIIIHMEHAAKHKTFTKKLFLPIKNDAKLIWNETIEKMKRNIVSKLRLGKNIIFEGILQTQETNEIFFKAFKAYNVILVKVDTPFEKVEQKEQARKNRINGWAKTHYFTMHKDKQYDLVVNTSKNSAKECAEQIKTWIENARRNRTKQHYQNI